MVVRAQSRCPEVGRGPSFEARRYFLGCIIGLANLFIVFAAKVEYRGRGVRAHQMGKLLTKKYMIESINIDFVSVFQELFPTFSSCGPQPRGIPLGPGSFVDVDVQNCFSL